MMRQQSFIGLVHMVYVLWSPVGRHHSVPRRTLVAWQQQRQALCLCLVNRLPGAITHLPLSHPVGATPRVEEIEKGLKHLQV